MIRPFNRLVTMGASVQRLHLRAIMVFDLRNLRFVEDRLDDRDDIAG